MGTVIEVFEDVKIRFGANGRQHWVEHYRKHGEDDVRHTVKDKSEGEGEMDNLHRRKKSIHRILRLLLRQLRPFTDLACLLPGLSYEYSMLRDFIERFACQSALSTRMISLPCLASSKFSWMYIPLPILLRTQEVKA